MPYTTPITDRTNADILAQNSKAYINVVDWNRIYRNAQLASALAEIELGTPIDFDILAEPTITTIPTVGFLNTLLANIERMRLAMVAEIPTLAEIKDDWEGGSHKPSPNYQYVNQWEATIDAIWDHWDGDDLEVCPTLTGDLTILTGTNVTYVDCLDMANFNVDIQGTGNLYII